MHVAWATIPAMPHRTNRIRVLIIDDEPLIIEMLGRILRKHYQLTLVESAKDALAIVDGGARFDVIVSDLMMPDFTGMDLFMRLSRTCADQAARMIFATGGATNKAAHNFLENAAHPPLYKPFSADQLVAAIERVRQAHKVVARRLTTGNVRTIRG